MMFREDMTRAALLDRRPAGSTSGAVVKGARAVERRLLFPPALRLVLAGYLFLSKPFGYIHVPGTPIYIGEVVLALGLVEILWLRWPWRPVISGSGILKVLLAFIVVCAARLATSFVDVLGSPIEILRDSSIWYYGAFALVVAYYATHVPHFTADFLRWFARVSPWFLVWTPLAVTVGVRHGVQLPGIPLPLSALKTGDMAVNCGLVVAFIILGLDRRAGIARRHANLFVVLGLGAIFIIGSLNRGGLIASLVVVATAFWLAPPRRRRAVVTRTGPLLLTVAAVVIIVNPRFETARREVSVRQVVSNMASVFGRGDRDQTGTVEWRIELWQDVIRDTLSVAYFLEGQGFGPNLYLKYGVDNRAPVPLRNPHSSHLDVLARTGIPGFLLWVLLWLTWWSRAAVLAVRQRRAGSWAHRNLTVWFSAAVTGYLITAVFDPAIEGPHAGIWMWSLVGLGAAHFRSRLPRPEFQPTSLDGERGPTRWSSVV